QIGRRRVPALVADVREIGKPKTAQSLGANTGAVVRCRNVFVAQRNRPPDVGKLAFVPPYIPVDRKLRQPGVGRIWHGHWSRRLVGKATGGAASDRSAEGEIVEHAVF